MRNSSGEYYRSVYDGEMRNGKEHGKGTKEWGGYDNRWRYEGEWRDGAPHGEGRQTFPNGHTSNGSWRAAQPYGKHYFYAPG